MKFKRIAVRSREKAYEILSIRDFGKPSEKMLRFWCLIIRHLGSTEKDSCNHMARNGQDVEELTTVFFLPGIDAQSVAYAFGRCMNAKGCYLTSPL
jgi:hypothetical protein